MMDLCVAILAVEFWASDMVGYVVSRDAQNTVLLPVTLLFKNVINFHLFLKFIYLFFFIHYHPA
jgi:hypothetical protein